MKKYALFPFLIILLVACSIPVDSPPPPTSIFTPMLQQAIETRSIPPTAAAPISTSTPLPSLGLDDIPTYLTAVPENFALDFCQDTRALQLLNDLRTVVQTRGGELLASLVSPASGVGVRYIRNGNVITYFDNIKFIFETTYEADWGLSPGSGEPVKGSFQKIVLPSLELVFSSNAAITCNRFTFGGATYIPEWPYQGMDYYSVYFPGTDEFNRLNWETWAVGMVRQEGKPMLAALVHFAWEP